MVDTGHGQQANEHVFRKLECENEIFSSFLHHIEQSLFLVWVLCVVIERYMHWN